MIALFGKVDRRLEPRDQVEQRGVDARDRAGRQRAVQLIERGPRLQRRHRIDEIGDRFGLRQIDAAVQIRAQRELAGLRQPRARRHGRGDHDRLSTTGLPCALSSTTSSPVYEAGAAK